MVRPAVVIGVGNEFMGDDAVGVRVVERLRSELSDEERAGVEIVAGGVAGMALMPHVLAADLVVFVDAIDAGCEPGAIFRFDPDAAGITGLRSTTTHGMGIPYLVTNARLSGHNPRFVVVAVQVGHLHFDIERTALTPPVETVVPQTVEIVRAELQRDRDVGA
jgi:hydrogenase maturation protease